jgi:hypothetical protein
MEFYWHYLYQLYIVEGRLKLFLNTQKAKNILHHYILMTINTASSTSNTLLRCRQCGKPIKFDDWRRSLKTGKVIPLDADVNQPHNCPARKQQQQQHQQPRQPLRCSKGCGHEMYFDVNSMTSTGKWIPLSKVTGEPHQCQ